MLRRILVAFILGAVLPATAATAPHRAVVLHRQALAQNDHVKALLELHKVLRTHKSLTKEQKLDILIAKAQFYQRYVADLDGALQTLEEARREIPGLEPNQARDLDERISALEKIISSHRDEKSFIDRFVALSPRDQMTMVEKIQERMEGAGSRSPYLGAFFHCLGVAYLEAQRFHDAYNAFHMALSIAPAIFFSYPTKELKETALARWKQYMFPTVAKLMLSVLLALILAGLFATRPWTWVRWRHLLPVPVLIVFWAIAHRLLIVLSSGLADKSISEGDNVVVHTHSGALLSGPLSVYLFAYGAMAMVAISLASLAVSRLRLPMTRYVANVCASFLIMGTSMLCFVLNHCQADIALGQTSRFQYMTGSLRYEMRDPSPYLLSSPRDFPGLAIRNLDEGFMIEYLKNMNYSEKVAHE
jgi:tetratricopeptide (TPR) repeat protein